MIFSFFGLSLSQDIPCKTEFGKWVKGLLKSSYLIGKEDVEWLDLVGSYWNGEFTKEAAQKALIACIKDHPNRNCDPFELFIDSNLMKP